uniref:Seroin transcript 1B n=1 Tax=Antheraea yamamai TaxID=7121 RepID=A0A3G1T159_ANTYA|nr:seroin transcript 1B [Antheraea yamamai]
MALTKIFLTLSLVALSNAVLMWPNDDGRFPPLPQMNMFFPDPIKFTMPRIVPFHIPPPPIMDRDAIKTHVAGPNEHFTGFSTSSHSFTSNDNGKITSGGGISTLTNDGKNVEENVLEYGDKGNNDNNNNNNNNNNN